MAVTSVVKAVHGLEVVVCLGPASISASCSPPVLGQGCQQRHVQCWPVSLTFAGSQLCHLAAPELSWAAAILSGVVEQPI